MTYYVNYFSIHYFFIKENSMNLIAYEFILKLDKNKCVKCTEGNSRLAEFV